MCAPPQTCRRDSTRPPASRRRPTWAGPSMPGSRTCSPSGRTNGGEMPNLDVDLDVAIVGAGAAGTYCAWRLQQALGADANIGLFEYSDRVGGRLYTVTMPGLPHVKAEVGGMRYIEKSHVIVAGLVKLLGLPTVDFPMGSPDDKVGSKCNLFYLRGQHLRLHELSDS